MDHNPSVCCNKRVNQDCCEAKTSLLYPPILFWEVLRQEACWKELSEPREIDFHSERNYMDIPVDIHCSEGNHIYTGIKCNVPSQISFKCGGTANIFFLSCNFIFGTFLMQVFIAWHVVPPWSDPWWKVADLRKNHFLHAGTGCSVGFIWLTWSKQNAHTKVNTAPKIYWPHVIVCISCPFFPMVLSASYLSTHASLAHTSLLSLLRGGTTLTEQALPLCRADRGSIWRVMLRKRLIKVGRRVRGLALSHREKHLNSWG